MTNLAGLHDIEATKIAPPGTWVLDTIALSENPAPKNYPASLNVIVRLNWGYGSTGTLPTPNRYAEYTGRLVAYVSASRSCRRWIIGNEPNLLREHPDNQPIFPWYYAQCYKMARKAIHAIPGHERDEVLIAAPGPWNADLKYPTNPTGDWIQYFADVIKACGDEVDGFALHAYTHGYDVALVTSSARMQPPFQNRRYEFRTYIDYLEAIPNNLVLLPCYITEANGNGPWQAVGLMPAMLNEIDRWNKSGEPNIYCVIFYRYPHYDDFYIVGRDDVIAEYQAAVGRGYTSPMMGATTMPETTFIPAVSTGTGAPALPPPLRPREVDMRVVPRGVTVSTPDVAPGQSYWFAKSIQWLDEQQSQGRHHILGNVYKNGAKVAGVPLIVTWPSGSARILTEDKSKDPPPFNYWYNYPMSPSLTEYSIKVDGLVLTETVKGIGMGADGNSHVHTSTVVEWELVTMPQAQQPTTPTGTTTPLYVNAPNGANLRAESNTDAAILDRIPYAFPVGSFGTEIVSGALWNHVIVSNGKQGWIFGALLSPEPMPAPKPVEPVTPQPSGDKWQRTIEWILKEEGGYTANDEGNPANFGINQGANPDLDVAHISREQAIERYRTGYWIASHADQQPWPFCLFVMNAAVQAGEGEARQLLSESGGDMLRFQGLFQIYYSQIKQDGWNRNGRAWMARCGRVLIEAAKP